MAVQASVLSNEAVASTVRKLTLRVPSGWTFQAGQFVILPVPPAPGDPKPRKGFYSVASSESRLPDLELLVEHRVDGGPVSAWVSALQAGTEIPLDGPLGHFGLAESDGKGQVFLGSRAGLAPLRAMLLSSLARAQAGHHWLFLGAQGMDDLLLDAEWRALEKSDSRFHYLPVIRPSADNPFVGKNQDPADAVIQKIAQRRGLRLYLAGFSADVEPMQAKLIAAGFAADDIKAEKFG